MRHVLPGMLARARGGIINVASLGGLVPGPYQAAYYASKAYVISLTEAVAAENAGSGVRFTAVAPGPVNTGFHAAMGSELSFYRQLHLRRSVPSASPAPPTAATCSVSASSCPALMNKLMWPALRVLPHRLLLPLIGWLLHPRDGALVGRRRRRAIESRARPACPYFVATLFRLSDGMRRESGLAYHGARRGGAPASCSKFASCARRAGPGFRSRQY